MDESTLKAIAARGDEILHRRLTLERLAVSWLHVLNENPSNLRPYLCLAAPSSSKKNIASDAANLARIARNVGRAALDRSLTRDEHAALAPADVVIVSQLVNALHLDSDQDFYFGDLQRMLFERGLSSLLVLRNHLPGPEKELRKRARRSGPRARLLLPRVNGVSGELDLARRMFDVRQQLNRESRHSVDPLSRAMLREAARQATSDASITTLRIHDQLESICRMVRPKALFVTYEGHAWERCTWKAARSVDENVVCVGYQHTVILKYSHAARRRIAPAFDPDMILTVGDVTRDLLAQSLVDVPVTTLGTHRSAADPPASTGNGPRLSSCLVLPEGIESECVILFGFAAECARLMPAMTFIFRLHPLMSFETLSERHQFLRSLPPNVELSTGTLDDDLGKSGYCLYRGSSTAIYAGRIGVKPIYLAREGEIPFDPLYILGTENRVVSAPDDFVAIAATPEDPAAERAARELCRRYVLPIQPEGLDVALAEAG